MPMLQLFPRADTLSFRNALDWGFLSQNLAPFPPVTLRSLASRGPAVAILFP
jgi:hypothetical protein